MTLPKTHAKLIEQGSQPKVTFIVSIPNDIAVEYTGATVFENRSFRYSSKSDFTKIIEGQVAEVLDRNGRVKLYLPSEKERNDLLDNLIHERRYYWKYPRKIEKDNKVLSAWGKSRGLDFIALINPGKLTLLPDRGHVIATKAVAAGYQGVNIRFLQFVITLFDVKNSMIDDIKYLHRPVYLNNPPFRKELTQQQLEKVKADWEFIVNRDYQYGVGAPTLESEIAEASAYQGDDYGNLTENQIDELDKWFIPHIEAIIEKTLVDLSFAEKADRRNTDVH
ncbi:MAG: hypothetical protein ABW096_16605 [Candidatus Thiodiazotropha sp.]